jgi:hypothetical protein
MMGVGFIAKELMMASTVGTDFVILAYRIGRRNSSVILLMVSRMLMILSMLSVDAVDDAVDSVDVACGNQ